MELQPSTFSPKKVDVEEPVSTGPESLISPSNEEKLIGQKPSATGSQPLVLATEQDLIEARTTASGSQRLLSSASQEKMFVDEQFSINSQPRFTTTSQQGVPVKEPSLQKNSSAITQKETVSKAPDNRLALGKQKIIEHDQSAADHYDSSHATRKKSPKSPKTRKSKKKSGRKSAVKSVSDDITRKQETTDAAFELLQNLTATSSGIATNEEPSAAKANVPPASASKQSVSDEKLSSDNVKESLAATDEEPPATEAEVPPASTSKQSVSDEKLSSNNVKESLAATDEEPPATEAEVPPASTSKQSVRDENLASNNVKESFAVISEQFLDDETTEQFQGALGKFIEMYLRQDLFKCTKQKWPNSGRNLFCCQSRSVTTKS